MEWSLNMRDALKTYLQPAFLTCVIILAGAAGGMSVALNWFDVHLKKEPLLLRKSLELLDESGLGTYKILNKRKIENPDVLKQLGTDDYIQWILEDTGVSVTSPMRQFMLFVTYYRLPDRVPHVPEECYTGGGYQRLASDGISFDVDRQGIGQIPGRYLVFGSTSIGHWSKSSKFPVVYLFKVNGEYANSRERARTILNKNLLRKYSYFCKIEIVFNQRIDSPDKSQAVDASERILRAILPVLEEDHWPKWE